MSAKYQAQVDRLVKAIHKGASAYQSTWAALFSLQSLAERDPKLFPQLASAVERLFEISTVPSKHSSSSLEEGMAFRALACCSISMAKDHSRAMARLSWTAQRKWLEFFVAHVVEQPMMYDSDQELPGSTLPGNYRRALLENIPTLILYRLDGTHGEGCTGYESLVARLWLQVFRESDLSDTAILTCCQILGTILGLPAHSVPATTREPERTMVKAPDLSYICVKALWTVMSQPSTDMVHLEAVIRQLYRIDGLSSSRRLQLLRFGSMQAVSIALSRLTRFHTYKLESQGYSGQETHLRRLMAILRSLDLISQICENDAHRTWFLVALDNKLMVSIHRLLEHYSSSSAAHDFMDQQQRIAWSIVSLLTVVQACLTAGNFVVYQQVRRSYRHLGITVEEIREIGKQIADRLVPPSPDVTMKHAINFWESNLVTGEVLEGVRQGFKKREMTFLCDNRQDASRFLSRKNQTH